MYYLPTRSSPAPLSVWHGFLQREVKAWHFLFDWFDSGKSSVFVKSERAENTVFLNQIPSLGKQSESTGGDSSGVATSPR